MATIDYASKYSPLVDERFSIASMTDQAFNQDYDFTGVATVNVYSVGTAPMNDYVMTGANRYGTPDELGATKQALTLTQDRSFTFTIDKRNYTDTQMVTESGKALNRQLTEVTIPEVDKYRISKLVAGAGTTTTVTAITNTNAYSSFLTGVATLLDNKVPMPGTFAFISTEFYKAIRLDGSFIKASDMAQNMLVTGQVGMVENVPLIYVPTAYLPTGISFLITNRIAAVAPQKIAEFKVNDTPQGISGWLAEGRIYHDAFVLGNKKKAIYAHKSA